MKIHVLKVPYDSGHRCERMARGPGYLLSNRALEGFGAVVEPVETLLPFTTEVQTAFDLALQIALRVGAVRQAGGFPLVLAGNCNSALGVISALGPRDTGVLWFDAHGEFHTPETTSSGFFDGMPLAIATGRCWGPLAESIPGFQPLPEENVVLVGVRDTDAREQSALEASSIARPGVGGVAHALDALSERVKRLYVHLDLDALDPSEATSNQWVSPGGLKISEVAEAIRQASFRIPIVAATLASFDPSCDADGRALRAARELLSVVVQEASR